jgi:hypothetical protein
MRFAFLVLAISSPAFLTHCGSDPAYQTSRSAQQPQAFTVGTQYYHRGSRALPPPHAAPLPLATAKPGAWARITGPPSAAQARTKGSTATQIYSTHGPAFVNPDGTTSRVIGNALVKSDGTRSTMIGNTVFHSNGTTSRIVGDILINADGTQSSRIQENP